jgi:hypothetical protein
MDIPYEVISNQDEIAKPVFNSTEEYREALNEFYKSLVPEFEKQDIARGKSEKLARQKIYS